ncbi:hypothetical protein ACHAW5_008603 [Stephanodiscus triporus]|uniref:Uncharacterized protein n=1 Tax=Stephanodiscus triporus TaxID=2934178 RepID=A0ABD3NHE4_9STRA
MSASSDPGAKAVNSHPPSSSSAGDDAAAPPGTTIVRRLRSTSPSGAMARIRSTSPTTTRLAAHPLHLRRRRRRQSDDDRRRTGVAGEQSRRPPRGSSAACCPREFARQRPRASEDIVSFLEGYDFTSSGPEAARYGYYRRPRRIGQDAGASSSSSSCPPRRRRRVDVERYRDPRQICSHALYRKECIRACVRSIVDNGSLSWIGTSSKGRKERGMLVGGGRFHNQRGHQVESHLATPRRDGGAILHGGPLLSGHNKRGGLSCMRDLGAHTFPCWRYGAAGLDAISACGVDGDQIPGYIRATIRGSITSTCTSLRLGESGCSVGGTSGGDVVQNLEMERRSITKRITMRYKLRRGAPLLCLMGGSS